MSYNYAPGGRGSEIVVQKLGCKMGYVMRRLPLELGECESVPIWRLAYPNWCTPSMSCTPLWHNGSGEMLM
jgi:hypothetical protein